MVRRYVGNGVWEDVPGTTPTPPVEPRAQDLDVALEEVATRFLAHLPESEFQTADRLFFQIEQAHWFYEDFLADAPGATLPHFHLRAFAAKLFERVPLLRPFKRGYEQAFADFRAYKGKIPVCGLILLDPTLTKVVLVCNWAKTSWGLPKGKLNQHESKAACAAREVYEETGYQVMNADQNACMFCVPDVDEDFAFEPRVRKEISQVKFFPLDALPSKQWNVDKFVPKIKRWAKQYRKKREKKKRRDELARAPAEAAAEAPEAGAEPAAGAPAAEPEPASEWWRAVPPEPDSDEEAYEEWLRQGGDDVPEEEEDDDESYVESDNPRAAAPPRRAPGGLAFASSAFAPAGPAVPTARPSRYDGEEDPWVPAEPFRLDVDAIMREPDAILDAAVDRARAREAAAAARRKLDVDAALAQALKDIAAASSDYAAGALAAETEALAEEVSYVDLEGAAAEMGAEELAEAEAAAAELLAEAAEAEKAADAEQAGEDS